MDLFKSGNNLWLIIIFLLLFSDDNKHHRRNKIRNTEGIAEIESQ